jgi:SAM-dependent methyltransferase
MLDVACGTGLNFERLERLVGPTGTIVGVDLSPEMLEVAETRVREHRLGHVELVRASVGEMAMEATFDAALFSFTHDILRSPTAIANVVGHMRPRARIAAAGVTYPASLPFARPVVRRAAARYVTTFEGLERPYALLEQQLEGSYAEHLLFGALFVVSGRVAEAAPRAAVDTTTRRAGRRRAAGPL